MTCRFIRLGRNNKLASGSWHMVCYESSRLAFCGGYSGISQITKEYTMSSAVSYAYVNEGEQRPTLMDQFKMCHDYAAAHGYTIAAELNEIDEPDHDPTGAVLDDIREAIAEHRATVILVFQPSAWALERLEGLGAPIEKV